MDTIVDAQRGETASVAGRDGGFILITFALLLIPIVVFISLAVDVSSWYSRATELQRTADSAALAGAVWMPDLGAAEGAATPVLQRNDVTDGSNNMTVTMTTGEEDGSFKVCVKDGRITQYFSSVFSNPTTITRCATAKFNAPLQLGSPLNYFGGNSSLSAYIAGTQPPNAIATVPSLSVFGSTNYCYVKSGSTVVGYWYRNGSNNSSNWSFIWGYNSTTRNCNTSPPAVPDLGSFSGGRICKVSGTSAYWDNRGSTDSGDWRYYPKSYGSAPTCGYNGSVNSPIPPTKSPNFWAAVEGYGNDHGNGDAYSTNGSEYLDTGYWYSIDIPAGFSAGSVSIQAWDGASNCDIGCRTPMGDDSGPHTRFRVYKAGAMKYDMSTLETPSCSSGSADSGYVTSNASWNLTWNELCNVAASPGDRFYVQVQSSDSSSASKTGGGYNGYAMRAVAGTAGVDFPASCIGTKMPAGNVACYEGSPATTQPRMSGYGKMEMYNGIPEGTPTEFYLANVTPDYAGKTLQIELFDPGDMGGSSSNYSWITVMAPSSTDVNGAPVPSSSCTANYREYGSTSWSSVSLSSGPGGAYSGTCTIQTTTKGSNAYQDRWLRIRIPLPDSYGTTGTDPWKCDDTVANPTSTPGSCWWQIKYYTQGGSLSDYTTWTASIVGDPVRLTM
jgi:hypothetical protein